MMQLSMVDIILQRLHRNELISSEQWVRAKFSLEIILDFSDSFNELLALVYSSCLNIKCFIPNR